MKTDYEVLLNALASLESQAASTNKLQPNPPTIRFGTTNGVILHFSKDNALERITMPEGRVLTVCPAKPRG